MRVGEVDHAFEQAQRLLRHPGLDVSSQTRCHLVLGTIHRDTGRVVEARSHYDRAAALAGAEGNTGQLCLAQMRLLTLQVAGDETAFPSILPALIRNVQKAGDPLLAIALHVCTAEIETRRGLLHLAKSQLNSARRLLQDSPNVFLEGNAAIAGLCLSLLCSEWDEAVRHGALALKSAEESGNVRTALAARLNLGQLRLRQGRPDEAEQHLQAALHLCPRGGDAEIGMLDALAQASLATGDTARCEALLGQIDRILATHHLPTAYNRYWGLGTRLLLLERQGRWHEAAELVTQVGGTIPTPPDSSMQARLTLAKAEIYLTVGRIEEANQILLEAANRLESLSLEHQGQLERLLALHAARRSPRDAPSHFERASRILVKTGSRVDRLRVLDEYSSFLAGWSSSRALEEGLVSQRAPSDSRHSFARLAALDRLSGDARLLGMEAFWLFAESGEDVNIALVTDDGPRERIVLALPRPSSWFSRVSQDSQRLCIHLGHAPVWRLYVQPAREHTLSIVCRTLAKVVQSIAETGEPNREAVAGRAPGVTPGIDTEGDPVFVSESMDAIVRSVSRVASTTLPILITGETGTGKEVLARLIHRRSSHSSGPLVAFNCATVPKELLDSQLFGHRRGAFTGAHRDFRGVIRSAEGGTLFLDEIGDLSRDAQPKLLRFLESGEVHPLGESRPTRAHVRIIAATNAPLDMLVVDGRFRQDLLYRLNAVHYELPPLRQRREEIPALVEHFLTRSAAEFQKGRVRLADEALDYLLLYSWPGNVRQLANEIRRGVALAEPNDVLRPEALSPEIVPRQDHERPAPARQISDGILVRLDQPLDAATDQLEHAMLAYALRATGGKLDAAAHRLGLSRKGLYLKRQRLGIES